MKKINSKGMMQGAIALSIAAFIAKILSAVYRVPFQNMVGNTGFYVYQQVYPIYGIGMTFALTGFPVFVSNVVAEYLESTHLKKLLKQLHKNSTKIAKEAMETGRGVYDLVLEHDILSKEDLDTILSPENMIKPVKLDIKPRR